MANSLTITAIFLLWKFAETGQIFFPVHKTPFTDDCGATRDVKGGTGSLVELAFSGRHIGISVQVLTQKFTGVSNSFRGNVAAPVFFWSP